MKKPEKLYEGNMRKKYIMFAIPLILCALLSQSYSFVNSMMIGKCLGSDAFAATAVTAEFIEFLNSIFYGYLTGIGIYVSTLFGKSEYEKMLNVIKINFMFMSILAIITALICNLFYTQLFDVLNVNEDIYENAARYFRTYTCGFIAFQINWGFTYISNGMGMTKIPLLASIITGVINVVLNYLFLSVFRKGIEYSALATIISSSVTSIVYVVIYAKLFRRMGIKGGKIKFDRDILKNSVDYGAPSMFQQMAMLSCTAIVSPLTNTCATAAISGYAIANKARSLILQIYQNSSKANTNLVAQALGAGRIDKIKQGIKIGITNGMIIFIVSMAAFMIFAKEFTALFLDPATEPESFAISVNTIRFLFPFIIFNVFNNLFHGIFRAVGSGKLMFISTLIYAVSYVIYAYMLFAVLPDNIRIYGVHIALSAAYITEVVFATVVFITGKWKSPEYIKLEQKSKL